MAEVKNAFIKSKMNKDLDSRLLPPGEYRDGLNIQVSKSEGEDVGALENAVGNIVASTSDASNPFVDFNAITGSSGLKTIGMYADESQSTLYIFLTNNSSAKLIYNSSASNFIYSYNTLTKNLIKLVEGAFLNFSTVNPIYSINIIENLLFWTDNRNQPRKINVNIDFSNYTTEDQISVAKYNPYQPIDLYYINPETIGSITAGTPLTSMQDVVSEFLPDSTTPNPFYNAPLSQAIPANENWPGDPNYLKDKFVSFSYRFKFSDGEYSITAPFTQEAFIPTQDGYFLGTGNTSDEAEAFRSSIVSFMENKVNNVGLNIPLPVTGDYLTSTLGIVEIDILYKESDGLSIKVLDTITSFGNQNILTYSYQSKKPYKTLPESETVRVYDKVPVRALGQEAIGNRIVYSNFQDKHTPPSSIDYDVIVSEKQNFSAPNNSNKALYTTSSVEYPIHTVKQNRNYQVGFILSDRYGRQSTTILAPTTLSTKTQVIDGISYTYVGSTYYHPYAPNPASFTPPLQNNINSWPGDSIKLVINQETIPLIKAKPTADGWPGLWNGDPSSPDYNPLGWYSYKVVVKQTEQDYYNVYLPGILNDYPDYTSNQRSDMPDPQGTIAHIALISDNINKVPRDLTEVGPEQLQYRSNVRLFGRVTPNFILDTAPTYNEPYYPGNNVMTVASISEQNNMFLIASRTPPYSTVYQTDSDPYIARITQNKVGSNPIGSSQINSLTNSYNIILGVFETAPFESLLDIFYETTTAGLVSDLNDAAAAPTSISGWEFPWIQTEGFTGGGYVFEIGGFYPTKVDGADPNAPIVDSTVTLISVTNSNGDDISDNWKDSNDVTLNTVISSGGTLPFTLTNGIKTYQLKVNNPLYFESTAELNEFTFTFNVIDNSDGTTTTGAEITVDLVNVAPTIYGTNLDSTTPPSSITVSSDRDASLPVVQFLAKNGTAKTSDENKEIIWDINDPSGLLSINSDGELFGDASASGGYNFTVTATDTNGAAKSLSTSLDIYLVFGQEQLNIDFGSTVNKQLSAGLESFSLYWASDYTSGGAISDGPFPGISGNESIVGNSYGTSNNNFGRPAYETGLTLPDNFNGIVFGKEQLYRQTSFTDTSPSGQSGTPYTFFNTNYTAKFLNSIVSDTDNSLKTGTAFIKLDFIFKSWPREQGSTLGALEINGASWPVYLQYRSGPGQSWSTAIDVEGQAIRFGGTQRNIAQPQPLPGSVDTFQKNGILQSIVNITDNGAIAGEPTNPNIPNEIELDTATATAQFPTTSNQTPATGVLSKVFVFGKDQGYKQTPDKFGEYRLLCRYPQGSITGSTYITLPTPNNNNGWDNVDNVYKINGALFTSLNVKVNITMGDFYYPSFSSTAQSYQFKATAPKASISEASLAVPNISVYAREWDLKYVTQFYTSPELRTADKVNFGTSGYVCYAPFQTSTSTSPGLYGTHNSWNGEQGANINTSNSINIANQRKWVASFSSDGLKVKGSATPITANVTRSS